MHGHELILKVTPMITQFLNGIDSLFNTTWKRIGAIIPRSTHPRPTDLI
jgi:hypothetical protein